MACALQREGKRGEFQYRESVAVVRRPHWKRDGVNERVMYSKGGSGLGSFWAAMESSSARGKLGGSLEVTGQQDEAS